jgi:hypothetical protein
VILGRILRLLAKTKSMKEIEIKKRLKLTNEEYYRAISETADNSGRHLINQIMDKGKRRNDEVWITRDGLEFLRNDDLERVQKKQSEFNRYLLLATFILASQVVMNYLDSYLNEDVLYPSIKFLIIMTSMMAFLVILIQIVSKYMFEEDES